MEIIKMHIYIVLLFVTVNHLDCMKKKEQKKPN